MHIELIAKTTHRQQEHVTMKRRDRIMKISKHTAQLIVDELREVINEHINFISTDGIIIYSTDTKRIATFHQAGLLCVKENRTVAVTNDDEYAGSKKGINMPLTFNGEIIAAIGITGEITVVNKYGAIIKKMTEILLKETYAQKILKQKRERVKYYLENLISKSEHDLADGTRLPGQTLPEGNPSIYDKFICIGKIGSGDIAIEQIDKLYEILENNLEASCLFSVFFNEIIIYSYQNTSATLSALLNSCCAEIADKIGYDFSFGVSEKFSDLQAAGRMYKEAEIAWRWGHLAQLDSNIFHYRHFDIELLLSSVPEETLKQYKKIILGRLADKSEYDFYANLLKIYVQCNCSLSACAEKLFIHKNTVQYRLTKLHQLTGFNPQNIMDLIKLYLAFAINI